MPDDLPGIVIDPQRLSQALGNLLSNTIKFTPAGGRVLLRSGVADGTLWIHMSDTGPGIAPEDRVHIFTPFYRVQQSGEPQQGVGLGLTIAHNLVAAHDGRLDVQSTLGQGTRFTIWIKVEPPAKNDNVRPYSPDCASLNPIDSRGPVPYEQSGGSRCRRRISRSG